VTRVIFWSELFWPHLGGIELLAGKLVRALRARGHDLVVVTSHTEESLPDQEDYHGIPVLRFPFRRALAAGDVLQLMSARRAVARLKQTFSPGLVHLYGVGPGALFHFQTRDAHPASLLVTLHAEVLRAGAGGPESLLERSLVEANWITAVSHAVKEAACRLTPVADRCTVIYSGVQEPQRDPTPIGALGRFLCLGRLVHDKGFDVALRSFASVHIRFPGTRLVVAGDGPLRGQLEAQAAELNLGAAVEFIGWVPPDRVFPLIEGTDIVLMPSRREGLPVAAIEAAHMARPVVASRVGGLPEVVIDGETGMLVEPDDPSALAAAMTILLEDPAAAERLGRAARCRAREQFEWNRHVAAFDVLYRTLTTPS
jgi:glycogen(starch) synthase